MITTGRPSRRPSAVGTLGTTSTSAPASRARTSGCATGPVNATTSSQPGRRHLGLERRRGPDRRRPGCRCTSVPWSTGQAAGLDQVAPAPSPRAGCRRSTPQRVARRGAGRAARERVAVDAAVDDDDPVRRDRRRRAAGGEDDLAVALRDGDHERRVRAFSASMCWSRWMSDPWAVKLNGMPVSRCTTYAGRAGWVAKWPCTWTTPSAWKRAARWTAAGRRRAADEKPRLPRCPGSRPPAPGGRPRAGGPACAPGWRGRPATGAARSGPGRQGGRLGCTTAARSRCSG